MDLPTVGKNFQEQVWQNLPRHLLRIMKMMQTMISLGAVKNYTDDGGRGPSDCIAYPNLAQVNRNAATRRIGLNMQYSQIFGANSPNISQQILTNIHSWATSQAQYALSSSALEQLLQKQASFIVNNSGKQMD